jgi:hypothetical protein
LCRLIIRLVGRSPPEVADDGSPVGVGLTLSAGSLGVLGDTGGVSGSSGFGIELVVLSEGPLMVGLLGSDDSKFVSSGDGELVGPKVSGCGSWSW